MSYRDVYFSRINHMGETTAERIINGGIRSFEKWMAESPFTVNDLSVERGLFFRGIIETNKDKEYEKIMLLRVANDIPVKVGDIMNWTVEDGSIEKWLLLQKVKKTHGTYQTFHIVRCNYLLKWVDSNGHLQQSWAYVVSSVDSKIKGNYRTWNSLITPQPNKYAEIIMPRYPINRATNFIIEEESWAVIEYDHTSVPGTIYLSLTENKINLIYDDIKNNIADTDKIAQYSLLLPEEKQTYFINDVINPVFTLAKNGIPFSAEYTLLPTDKTYCHVVNDELIATSNGNTTILVQLKDYPQIQVPLEITIGEETPVYSAYIDGPDKIPLDRYRTYTLKGSDGEVAIGATFSVNNNELVTITKIEDEKECILHANANNKLGSFVLTATYDGVEYTKEITVIPLW